MRKTAPAPSLTKKGNRPRMISILSLLSMIVILPMVVIAAVSYILTSAAASKGKKLDDDDDDHYVGGDKKNSASTTKEQSSSSIIPALPPWWETRQTGEVLKGSFVFGGTNACSESSSEDNIPPCIMHFPSESSADHLLPCDYNDGTSTKEGITGMNDQRALCLRTQKGYKPPLSFDNDGYDSKRQRKPKTIPNQDRSLILQPLVIPTPHQQSSTTTNGRIDNSLRHPLQKSALSIVHETDCMLMLLADGHGTNGHISASAVQRDLPRRILNLLDEAAHEAVVNKTIRHGDDLWNVPQLLTRAFLECDEYVMSATPPGSGATAVVVLKIGNNLYMASVGDSTAIVAEWENRGQNREPGVRILANSIKHKPHLPEERKRIEAKNGRVMLPYRPGESSRVIIPSTTSDGAMATEMALAMSRSLGDKEGKIPGWLSAEPSVVTIPLLENQMQPSSNNDNKKQYFVMISSDGVTDTQPTNRILQKLGMSLFGNGSSLGQEMDAIMKKSQQGWARETMNSYRDDMTILASRISPTTSGRKRGSIHTRRFRGPVS